MRVKRLARHGLSNAWLAESTSAVARSTRRSPASTTAAWKRNSPSLQVLDCSTSSYRYPRPIHGAGRRGSAPWCPYTNSDADKRLAFTPLRGDYYVDKVKAVAVGRRGCFSVILGKTLS